MPRVAVVMGSRSDEPYARKVTEVLDRLGLDYEVQAISAHRNPERLREYARGLEGRGVEVVIALAGGSAALPGVLAAWTPLPVIGVPLPTSDLRGVDALYSIAQMPPGVPVACVAVGEWGARNAAYLACAVLALKHEDARRAYREHRERLAQG